VTSWGCARVSMVDQAQHSAAPPRAAGQIFRHQLAMTTYTENLTDPLEGEGDVVLRACPSAVS
jgi:hypothetical protein